MKRLLLFLSLCLVVNSFAIVPDTSNTPRQGVGSDRYEYYGTAAAPAITSVRDKNTGISFTTADTINFATGGTNRMSIDSSGLSIAGGFIVNDIQEVSPNTSVTTSITASTLLVYNGATVGTANIVLPTGPVDGQIVNIVSQPAITVMTITAGAITVNGGATSMTANTGIAYMYSATTTDWHKYK